MRYPLVIFDFDGTLADSFPFFLQAQQGLAQRHGFTAVAEDRVEALRHLGPREIMRELAVPAWKLPVVVADFIRAMRDAPRQTRILVVGVCMETDSVWPMLGINKELTIQFALGYTPEEFSRTLTSIASGDIDVAPLITGEVGIAGVPGAFAALANPDAHAKILVVPALG